MNLNRSLGYSWWVVVVVWVYTFFSVLFFETESAKGCCYCYFLTPLCSPEWRTVLRCRFGWTHFKRGLKCFCNCKKISLSKPASHYPASGNAPSILFLSATSHSPDKYQTRMRLGMHIRSGNVCCIKVMNTWISNLFYIFQYNIHINSVNFIAKIVLLSKLCFMSSLTPQA